MKLVVRKRTQQLKTIKVEFKTNNLRFRRELGIYAGRGSTLYSGHTGGSNLQLAAETCEFSQDPPLSMGL